MPAAAKWTTEQKTAALTIYRNHGPAEAARQTGIAKGTIASWAHRDGVQTLAPAATRAATEMSVAKAAEKRAQLRASLLTNAVAIADRLNAPYDDVAPVPGKGLVEYQTTKPPAPAVRALAGAVETLVKTLRLEEGETTSNTGVTVSEGFSIDAALEDFRAGVQAATGSPGSVAEHGPHGAASAG